MRTRCSSGFFRPRQGGRAGPCGDNGLRAKRQVISTASALFSAFFFVGVI